MERKTQAERALYKPNGENNPHFSTRAKAMKAVCDDSHGAAEGMVTWHFKDGSAVNVVETMTPVRRHHRYLD